MSLYHHLPLLIPHFSCHLHCGPTHQSPRPFQAIQGQLPEFISYGSPATQQQLMALFTSWRKSGKALMALEEER